MSNTTVDHVATESGRRVPVTSRAWAWSGVVAGVLGIAAIEASLAGGADWEKTQGDAAAIVEDASTKAGTYLVFHLLAALCAIVVPVFAAGLQRRLDQQAPAGVAAGPGCGAGAWGSCRSRSSSAAGSTRSSAWGSSAPTVVR